MARNKSRKKPTPPPPEPVVPDRWSFLFRAIPGETLGLFRIVFGLALLFEAYYLWSIDFTDIYLAGPKVHFHYDLIPLPVISQSGLDGIIVLLFASAVLIILGLFYRPAMVIYTVGFSYLFFLDKAYYNNHLYLICLLGLLLSFMPADRTFSLRSRLRPKAPQTIPAWTLWALRLQLVIVYFYGGIAKLNADWLLDQQPARLFLEDLAGGDTTSWITSDGMAWFVAYGGLGFDLLIGAFLLLPRLRKLGLIGVLFFNATNAWIFNDINVFPYLMMGSAILFLDPAGFQNWLNKVLVTPKRTSSKSSSLTTRTRPILLGLGVYFAFQLIFPFRHHLFVGNTDWTMHAQYFSWRMKIQHRTVEKSDVVLLDYDKKVRHLIDLTAVEYGLNRDQIQLLGRDPGALLDFSHFLSEFHRPQLQSSKVGVNAEMLVRFNGRAPQPLVPPDLDLMEVNRGPFVLRDWVVPLAE